MPRYFHQVKLYAIDERRSGKPWRQIQKGIWDKFNVEPPSIRAMEKWTKTIDREKLSQMIIEESKKNLPSIEASALKNMAASLLPVLWQARDAGKDMELEAWLWFFSIIERELGKDKFDRFLAEYTRRKAASEGSTT